MFIIAYTMNPCLYFQAWLVSRIFRSSSVFWLTVKYGIIYAPSSTVMFFAHEKNLALQRSSEKAEQMSRVQ